MKKKLIIRGQCVTLNVFNRVKKAAAGFYCVIIVLLQWYILQTEPLIFCVH